MLAAHDNDLGAHRDIVENQRGILAGIAEDVGVQAAAALSHDKSATAHPDIRAILAVLTAEIQLLKDTLIVAMEQRLLYMVGDLATVELREGVYNAALSRIEC